MAFLTINGWRIELAQGGASRELVAQGELAPAWSNRPNRKRQALSKKFSFTTVPLDPDDATTLEGLLEGRGHYWGFRQSLHSSAGLGPEAGHPNISFPQSTTGAAEAISARFQGTVIFDTQLPDSWTVSYLIFDISLGWLHKVIRSDGAKWLNGTRNDGLAHDEFYVSSGAVVLSTIFLTSFGRLIVLPFKASSGFIESLRPRGAVFSSLPRLNISGDITGGKTIEVMGTSTGQSYQQRAGWVNNRREVQAELEEVVPRKEGPTLPFRAHTSFVFNQDTLGGTTRRPIVGDFASLTNAGQTYTTSTFVPGDQYLSRDGTQASEYSGQDMTNSLQGASIISGVVAFYPTSFASSGVDVFIQLVDDAGTLGQIELYYNSSSSQITLGATPTNSSEQLINIIHTISLGYLYVIGFFADFASGAMGVGWCRGVNTGVYGSPLQSGFTTGNVSFTATSFQSPTTKLVNFLGLWNGATNYGPRGTAFYAALIKDRRISESDLRQTYRAITSGNFR